MLVGGLYRSSPLEGSDHPSSLFLLLCYWITYYQFYVTGWYMCDVSGANRESTRISMLRPVLDHLC